MDRRAVFFLMAAVVCFLLIWPTPEDLRWVPLWLGVTYVVLSGLSFADFLSRRNATRSHQSGSSTVNRTDP